MKIEALTIRISCLADDVGPVSSLKKKQGEFECPILTCPVISCHALSPQNTYHCACFTDRHLMQIMQGVYTDHMTADMPPDSICSISGSYVLTGVKQLKDGDAAEEEMHRREAAQGMLHLQDAPGTVTKSELIFIMVDAKRKFLCTPIFHTQGLRAALKKAQWRNQRNKNK